MRTLWITLQVVLVCSTFATVAPGAEPSQPGPRLSDAELLAAIDLKSPGLQDVAEALSAGDRETALGALAKFLRKCEEPYDFGQKAPRDPRYNLAAAKDVIRHRFTVVGIPYTFQGEIDWYFNPTTAPGSENPRDHEWTWQLNRHGAWSTLARAYRATGDERYAREFAAQLQSWIRSCPVPEKAAWQGPTSSWRTIECGIRTAGSWATAWTTFRSSTAVSDRLLIDWLKLWIEHGRYLHAHPTGRNWLTMEFNGLYHVGTLIPFAKEAKSWRSTAAGRLRDETRVQVYPDGAQDELSPGYHNVALRNMLGIPRLAAAYGHQLPDGYLAGLEKMFAYNLWAMRPDRSLPRWNDSWHTDVPALLAGGLRFYPHRQDFLWIATDGKQGRPPEHTSHFFPWAGQVIMRSGWTRDALYLGIELGPFGTGHQHEDKLGVVLFAYGRALLVEGGSYAYDASKWRRYVLNSHAHNVVLVDGAGQQRRGRRDTVLSKSPIDCDFQSNESLDFARGVYDDGFAGGIRARHTRAVLFDKPNALFVIRDRLTALDDREHRFEALWHLDAPRLLEEPDKGIYETEHAGGANLRLVAQTGGGLACRVVRGQEEPVVQGWLPLRHGRRGVRPSPCVVCALSGRQVEFVTVLQPLKSATQPRVVGVTRRNGAVEVTFSNGNHTTLPWPK